MSGTDVSTLRSWLQRACSDLRNLTTAELLECKWSTKKKVLIHLVSIEPSLRDQNDELLDLIERRNIEMSKQKREGASREQRIESESSFRTKFVRIVLDCLTKLRWPPAFEAFSDPIDSLLHDSETFFNAVELIVRIAIPSIGIDHSALPKTSSSHATPALREEHNNTVQSLTGDCSNADIKTLNNSRSSSIILESNTSTMSEVMDSVTAPNLSSTKQASKSQSDKTSTVERDLSSQLFSMYASSSASTPERKKNNKQMQDEQSAIKQPWSNDERTGAGGVGTDMGIGMSAGSSELPLPQQEHYHHMQSAGTTRRSREENIKTLNWRAFEVLQHQNELLSSRLRDLQLHVMRREEVEGRVGTVLRELRGVVGELVDVGGSGVSDRVGDMNTVRPTQDENASFIRPPGSYSNDTIAAGGGGGEGMNKGNFKVTIKEREEFLSEIERERHATKSKKNISLGTSAGVMRPEDARGTNKRELNPHHTPLSSSSSSSSFYPQQQQQQQQQSSSSIIWARLQQRLSKLENEWNEAQVATRQAVVNQLRDRQYMHEAGYGNSSSSSSSSNAYPSGGASPSFRPSQAQVHRTLGVTSGSNPSQRHPPQQQQEDGSGGSGGGGAFTATGLDLPRVHLLQRDLVAFAERAFAWTSATAAAVASSSATTHIDDDNSNNNNNNNNNNNTNDIATSSSGGGNSISSVGRQVEAAQALQFAAWELLTHLACIAPMAPLALPEESPLRSHLTGIHALIAEVQDSAFPKLAKPIQLRIQSASDRARAEQVAVVRCLHQARNMLLQWGNFASHVQPAMQSYMRRCSSIVSHAVQDLHQTQQATDDVLAALQSAEDTRIHQHTSSSSRSNSSRSETSGVRGEEEEDGASASHVSAISPLDSLSRGVAGREVASLVNTLRAKRGDMSRTATRVQDLTEKLTADLHKELRAVQAYQDRLSSAAALTSQQLRQAERTAAADASGAGASAGAGGFSIMHGSGGGGGGGGRSSRRGNSSRTSSHAYDHVHAAAAPANPVATAVLPGNIHTTPPPPATVPKPPFNFS